MSLQPQTEKSSTGKIAAGTLPERLFIRNPLDVLGFTREPFVGKTPEEAMPLIKVLHRFWAGKIHPDKLNQHEQNPKNGGDNALWQKYLSGLPEWNEIDQAYQDLQNPEICAAAIADFKPATRSKELEQVRDTHKRVRGQSVSAAQSISRYLTERFDSRTSLMNYFPGVLQLRDLGAILDTFVEGDLSGADLIGKQTAKLPFLKTAKLDKDGFLLDRPGARVALILDVPTADSGLTEFVALLRAAGLKVPVAMLTGPDGAGSMAAPLRTYRLDSIRESELADFIPFVGNKMEVSSAQHMRLLLSVRNTEIGRTYAIEGVITGAQKTADKADKIAAPAPSRKRK